jgi:tetratricopeptide (TPR) repeat protein
MKSKQLFLLKLTFCCLVLPGAVPFTVMAQPSSACGTVNGNPDGHYGPFDYRHEKDGRLRIVDIHHFTPQVEALIRGKAGYLHDDLNYVLRASPNHHRALVATIRYAARLKTQSIHGMQFSVECFLDRAVRFAPDDTVARALYAQYLGTIGRQADGVAVLDSGLSYATDNPFSASNFGLIYLELGDAEKALKQAHRAIELGDTRQQLIDLLKRAGKWREPGQ